MSTSFVKKIVQMQCQAENFIQEVRNKTLPELKQRADNFVQEVKQEYQSAKQQRRSTGMGISLEKGQNLSLTKNAPTLKHLQVGLGWDTRSTDGQAFDLDASAFMVGENGKVPSDAYFIFS